MAIQFARIEIVSRSGGGNACRKGAYNAGTIVKDEKTNIKYDFSNKTDNVYHEILLPEHVDKSFVNTSVLMNAVEHIERKNNSQLLKDIVIALPDDKELNLQDRINITHEIIEEMQWIKEGLAVQLDIHKPHEKENNWHAHLLVTTRRFTQDGKRLSPKKARDLNPEFKAGKHGNFIIPEEDIIHERGKRVINNYFKKLGLENRVDAISSIPQEQIGPVRMRSVLNKAVERNEYRQQANIESLINGEVLLDRITKHQSVFSERDLSRIVKCVIDKKIAGQLVAEALTSDQIIALYEQDGKSTRLYTTEGVRKEEQKLLRLASYINQQENLLSSGGQARQVKRFIKDNKSLTSHQLSALSHILLAEGGMRVLKGRAGTGKSHVLGEVVRISRACNVEVLGLSPTHKAKQELQKVGYDKTDTIKGFLFKLYNNKAELLDNSLVVVDEAAMVGNDDFSELLRVAASRKCNVILAGDERQLPSIQRGGMFGELAERFSYYELSDIKRQKAVWGRQVAVALSRGEVMGAIEVLIDNNRLDQQADKIASMERLLLDWKNSNYMLQNKIIVAINNRNVDNINIAVRELLKADGILIGAEYQVSRSKVGDDASAELCFMQGERLVFNESNKGIGVNNGDFGSLIEVSKEQFIVRLDNGQQIRFNPSRFSGFKYGYASTIYKAQGASIKDVYVLHDGFSTMQNSYVALSRHIEDVHLYVNNQATPSLNHLVRQLGFDVEKAASISFLTKEDLLLQDKERIQQEEQGLLLNIGRKISGYVKQKLTILVDKHKVNSEYYIFEKPELMQSQVEEVLESADQYDMLLTASNGQLAHDKTRVQAVVGGYNKAIEPKSRMTAKERFYANVEYQRQKASKVDVSQKSAKGVSQEVSNKIIKTDIEKEDELKYQKEIEYIRSQVKFNAERIAISLLGTPNQNLSNGTNLRYGEHGKLAIRLRGEKAGNWYNFAENKGGDMFKFIQEYKGISFVEAIEFAKNIIANDNIKLDVEGLEVGLDKQIFLRNKGVNEDSETNTNHLERLAKVQEVYAKSKPISMASSEVDFSQVKVIDYRLSDDLNKVLQEQVYSNDLKNWNVKQGVSGLGVDELREYANAPQFYEANSSKSILDAIGSFVVDSDADITGVYLARLDKELAVIEQSGYAEDFLIAANIARVCQHFNIRYEIRGSSSSSLVARALNIHKIDPIKHDLLFERFLGSGNQPDFDFDIDSSRKYLVENYLMYAYQGRAGKMMTLKDGKLAPHACAWGIKDVGSSDKVSEPQIENGKFTIDYKDCQEVKKFDLLSSKELNRLEQVTELVGVVSPITMSDSKTYQLLASGDVRHLFQINQSREICRQLSPKNFNDLVNLLAVIRPGARHNIEILSGKERSNIADPLGVFNSTKGAILFQEQIMQAAHQYFAVPLEQTNRFRKDLVSGKIDKEAKVKYIANSSLATAKEAECLFSALEQASKFVYNKAHAVAYAYATYKSAYVKTHYQAEFDKIYTDKETVKQLAKVTGGLEQKLSLRGVEGDEATQTNRLLAEFASVEEFAGGSERRTAAYSNVCEDSSAVPMPKLPTEVELCKKSNDDKREHVDCFVATKVAFRDDGMDSVQTHQLTSSIYDAKIQQSELIARSYLVNHRGIKGQLPEDIRVTYQQHAGKIMPMIVAFARNSQSEITGMQSIYLDKITGNKITQDIGLAKRSLGQIKGSFVKIQKAVVNDKQVDGQQSTVPKITIIAEGIETALSIKEAELPLVTILCSLGVSNIRNYQPTPNEHIIIAADNDGIDSASARVVLETKFELGKQGAIVDIVSPPTEGDFNDILRQHAGNDMVGKLEISKLFAPIINRLAAKTLDEYLASIVHEPHYLTEITRLTRKAEQHGLTEDELMVIVKSTSDTEKIATIIDQALEMHYIKTNLEIFAEAKEQAKIAGATADEILKIRIQEQNFLASLHDQLKYPDHHPSKLIESINQAHEWQRSKINLDSLQDVNKVNANVSTMMVNKIIKQIDLELANEQNRCLIPKRININNLRVLAIKYAIVRSESQEFIPLSDNQTKALISRTVFELNNRRQISNIFHNMWVDENPDEARPLSEILKYERIIDKITKVSGYLVEGMVLNNPEKHLSIKKSNDIITKALNIGKSRQKNLAAMLDNEPQIKELSNLGSNIQRSVAEQLLDYRLQHGEINVTAGKFESMKIAAEIEQAQSKSIMVKLNKALTPSFNDNNIDDIEKSAALSEGKNLVIHNLRIIVAEQKDNVHMQDDYTEVNHYNSNKNYYNGSITKTINQIRSFQKALDRQRLEEMQREKTQQSRGMSMGM